MVHISGGGVLHSITHAFDAPSVLLDAHGALRINQNALKQFAIPAPGNVTCTHQAGANAILLTFPSYRDQRFSYVLMRTNKGAAANIRSFLEAIQYRFDIPMRYPLRPSQDGRGALIRLEEGFREPA